MEYVKLEDNLAYIFTKSLSKNKFDELKDLLNISGKNPNEELKKSINFATRAYISKTTCIHVKASK